MNFSTDQSNNLGPLPKRGRNQELEQLSIRALKNTLPVDKFLFRDERVDDAGVDGSIEILSDSESTNIRTQVQLKGTDVQKVNADGSISHQVDTSNLNYLLNGQSPIYVLYIASSKELRFVWAHEERKRLEQTTPQWMEQSTITLRFRNVLSPAALNEIYERVKREARMHRRTLEILGRASAKEQVTISFDPQTLISRDPAEVKIQLLTSGMNMSTSGFPNHVLELFDVLSPSIAKTPRLQLVHAYALYTLGRYLLALGYIAEALSQNQLDTEDEQFLLYLKDSCDFQTRRITLEEYLKRETAQTQQGSGIITVTYRLIHARETIFSGSNLDSTEQGLANLQSIVSEVMNLPDEEKTFKIQANLTLLFAQGMQFVRNFVRGIGEQGILRKMGRPSNLQSVLQRGAGTMGEWEAKVESIRQEAVKLENSLLLADVLITRVSIRVFYLIGLRFATFPTRLAEAPEHLLYETMSDTEHAQKIYVQAGHLEGELQARMAFADLFDISEQLSPAQEMAKSVLPKAQVMEYKNLEYRAKEHISGQTLFAKHKARLEYNSTTDSDLLDANISDEKIPEIANELLKTMQLPPECLIVFERCAFSVRDIARERLHWCQYLELHERKGEANQPLANYKVDPLRVCRCSKYQYQSAIENPDWKLVISSFKQAYCSTCLSRDPKIKQ